MKWTLTALIVALFYLGIFIALSQPFTAESPIV
jgi:hypothetical protein